MSASVVWAMTDPRGHVIGGVYAHHDDALADCTARNELIREAHPDMHGDYCRLSAMAFFADRLQA